MKEDIKKRDSNLECCRIITMAIIVLNHVVSLGGTLPENIIKLHGLNGIFVSASQNSVLDNRKGPAKAGPPGYSCSKQLRM